MHRRAEGSEGTSPKATAKRRASVCVKKGKVRNDLSLIVS